MRYTTIGHDPSSAHKVSLLSLGAMRFGTTTDEATSFAILDRYVAVGGNFIDTSDNYAFWAHQTQGGESEALLGRWRASRGVGDEVVIATKVGARPLVPAADFDAPREGLSRAAIRTASQQSRERLGVERIDLYYAHIPDDSVPLEEQVAAFGELVADGTVGLLGLSNHWAWQLERARTLAAAAGPARPDAAGPAQVDVLQYHHTYLRMRTDIPDRRFSPDGEIGVADGSILSYLRSQPNLTLVAYSPLLNGAYTRPEKQLERAYDHPGTRARLDALDQVVKETGATANQVVLAWLIGGDLPIVPLVGASSVAQLDESLAAVDLELTPEQRQRLDAAN
jgi:aryl-alcohol dehydrogenase-like predicted oxidoreductase